MFAALLSSRLALSERFLALTSFLKQHRFLWEPRTFVSDCVPWEEDYPALSAWTRSLSVDEIDAFESSRAVPLGVPGPFDEWRAEALRLSVMGDLEKGAWAFGRREDKRLSWKISARKWSQIQAFIRVVQGHWDDLPVDWLDWCAGKGHLGRTMAACSGGAVHCVERQGALCDTGKAMAERLHVDARFSEADVLSPETWSILSKEQSAIALHACGALTDTLLRMGVQTGLSSFAVVPCCHHFVADAAMYQPLSEHGLAADMPLDKYTLRLSIADEVLATPRERLMRRRELAFRLGFDRLVREASGATQYESMGNLPNGALRQSFSAFCEQMSAYLQRPLPNSWNADVAEHRGWELAREARGRALVRGLFRRPLELWLVLDRALFLAEQGYNTRVGCFCPASMTPRNLMILAQ